MRKPVFPLFIGSPGRLLLGLISLMGIVSPRAAELEVTVVSVPNRESITNATVTVEWEPDGRRTIGPGTSPFRFDLPASVSRLRITATSPGWAPLESVIQGSETAVTLALPLAQTLGGSVVDAAEQPLPGVEVFLNFPRKLGGPRVAIERHPIVTGTDGRWQADWVPADVTLVRVQFRHVDFETSGDLALPLEQLRDHSARTVMYPLARLEGVVLSPTGVPVPEADVFYGDEHMLWGVEENQKTRTDAEGRFWFVGLPMKPTALGAYSPAYAPVAQLIDLKPGLAPVTLKLAAPHTLAARVVDQAGQGVAGVQLRWDEAGQLRYPGWTGVTDSAGRFQITNCIAGEITVDLTKEGFLRMSARLKPEASEHTLLLPPVVRFAGTVVEEESGRPVQSFRVIPGLFLRGIPWEPEKFRGNEYGSKTFGNGVFALTLDAPAIGQVPPPLRHGLRIVADGFRAATLGPFEAGNDHLEVRLQPLTRQTLRVLRPDDQPAAGAELQLGEHFYGLSTTNGRVAPVMESFGQRGQFRGTANERGVIVLDDDPEPRFGLIVHDSGFQLLPATMTLPESVRLESWGGLEGTLSLRGQPLAHQSVALLLPMVTVPHGTNVRWYPNPLGNQGGITDAEGRFRFDRVPPGELISIALTDPEVPIPGMGRAVGQPQYPSTVAVVTVSPGPTTLASLDLTGTDVSGTIVLPFDAPPDYDWKYAQVHLTRVLPEIVPPDGLDDTARSNWFRGWFHSEAAASLRPWIRFRTGFGVHERLNSEGRSVPVQPDGSFRFRALPPGDYQLQMVLLRSGSQGGQPEPELWEYASQAFTLSAEADDSWSLGNVGWAHLLNAMEAPEPTDREPVTVGLSWANPSFQPGIPAQVRVWVRVAPGHHIYSAEEPSPTYTPISLKLTLPEGWTEYGEWSQPVATAKDGHSILSGDLIFRRYIRIPPQASGTVRLNCEVRVQACNADFCWPPRSLQAETVVELPAVTLPSKTP